MDEYFDPEEEEQREIEAIERFEEGLDFAHRLVSGQLKTPNEFTKGMGALIRKAREQLAMSQADVAKLLGKRKATISAIENGKSEISVFTLAGLAMNLHKPISYFFPDSILKDTIADVKTTFEHEVVELAREIEQYEGDKELAIEMLKFVQGRAAADFFQPFEDQDA